jgi:hypothetical protein
MKNRLYPTFVEYLKKVQKTSLQEVQLVENNDEVQLIKEAEDKVNANFEYYNSHEKITIYADDNNRLLRELESEKESYGDDYLNNN